MTVYNFDRDAIYESLKLQWLEWASSVNAKKWVLGISGGKDSTIVAAMAANIFGRENVYGVMLPNGTQKDINDSLEVIRILGINSLNVNLESSFKDIMFQLDRQISNISYDTKVNLPPRLRMSILYAVAQSIDGIVLNTSNLSERMLGYSTLFGDSLGSYAPLKNLTTSEVIKLGKLPTLNLPDYLVDKVPSDGLQDLSDEEKLGLKYIDVDKFIREGICENIEVKDRILSKYKSNKFKLDIININGPIFDNLLNYITKKRQ